MQVLKVTFMVVIGLTLESDRRRGYLFPGPAVMLPFLLSSIRTFPCVINHLPTHRVERWGSGTLMYNLMIEIQ